MVGVVTALITKFTKEVKPSPKPTTSLVKGESR